MVSWEQGKVSWGKVDPAELRIWGAADWKRQIFGMVSKTGKSEDSTLQEWPGSIYYCPDTSILKKVLVL